ncbi:MAG: primosomal protein N' [bacterium]|nr:primosomal protein N' [bacterium]
MKIKAHRDQGPIAQVVVPGVNKIFHYTIPDDAVNSVEAGHRVSVSLGHRTATGYVVGRLSRSDHPRLKPITAILDTAPLLSGEMVHFTRWIADYYFAPWGSVIRTVLPGGFDKVRKKTEGVYVLKGAPEEFHETLPALVRRAPAQAKVISHFLSDPAPCTGRELAEQTGVGPGVFRSLMEKGILLKTEREVHRSPFFGKKQAPSHPPTLTPEQQHAMESITAAMEEGGFGTFLLHGVTGSGKTEIYLRAIERALAQGRTAIIIVPEIALTPQLVRIFSGRLGERIAVLHSGLSPGERVDQWHRIREGRLPVVIGARSAIFAPLSNLGIIVVDEEHDGTYKQEETPRYHARDLAVVRGSMTEATVILGSATPSVESFYHARQGKYRLLSLEKRIHDRPLPEVRLIDMKREPANASLSSELNRAVKAGLARKEQVLLFLNRRGFAPFLLCDTCGHVVECPNCSVCLTYHLQDRSLWCHHCGFATALKKECPECHAESLELKGSGTERIEEEVEEVFSEAVLLRLDRDTTRKKGALESILDRFRSREGDILIGTQMVTKGHHLPGITTVGVLNADSPLHHPDFRSGERTFQILTQVAGRAGRGESAGTVYLQTYTPEHYAIQAAVGHDYELFFREEIGFRKALDYPPYSRLVNLVLSANSASKVENAAARMGKILRGLASRNSALQVLGPARAPIAVLRGKRRYQILIKGKKVRELNQFVAEAVARFNAADGASRVNLTIDVDPISFF